MDSDAPSVTRSTIPLRSRKGKKRKRKKRESGREKTQKATTEESLAKTFRSSRRAMLMFEQRADLRFHALLLTCALGRGHATGVHGCDARFGMRGAAKEERRDKKKVAVVVGRSASKKSREAEEISEMRRGVHSSFFFRRRLFFKAKGERQLSFFLLLRLSFERTSALFLLLSSRPARPPCSGTRTGAKKN